MSFHNRNSISYARPRRRNDVDASTSSAVSAAIGDGIYLVYVFNASAAKAYVRPGDDVSSTNGLPLPSGQGYHMAVRPGETIAAILASGTGAIEVVEMTV